MTREETMPQADAVLAGGGESIEVREPVLPQPLAAPANVSPAGEVGEKNNTNPRSRPGVRCRSSGGMMGVGGLRDV